MLGYISGTGPSRPEKWYQYKQIHAHPVEAPPYLEINNCGGSDSSK